MVDGARGGGELEAAIVALVELAVWARSCPFSCSSFPLDLIRVIRSDSQARHLTPSGQRICSRKARHFVFGVEFLVNV